ncbi:MAG: hypothetical protein V2I46_00745 [Bacteroides sp.]|nr:hypothetical protein [Bacteroides sp.]
MIFFVAIIVTFSACSPKTYNVLSSWQPSSVSFEPGLEGLVPQGADGKTKLGYAVSNDEESLYLAFQTDDPVTQMKILRAGLELEIASPYKGNIPAMLKYPVPEDRITIFEGIGRETGQGGMPSGNRAGRRGGQNQPDPKAILQRALAEQTKMKLKGFQDHPNGMQSLENEDGIKLNVDIDGEGMMFYRVIIPLRTLGVSGQAPAFPKDDFTLTVRMNGLERFDRQGGGYGNPGTRDRGYPGGMRPGGSMTGMPYGGQIDSSGMRERDPSRLSKDERIKILFKLAQNN